MAVYALRIGIEIEVLLRAINMADQCKSSREEFAEGLTQHYNTKVRDISGQIEMRMSFHTWHAMDDPVNIHYWAVTDEASIDLDEDHCKHLIYFSMWLVRVFKAPFSV